MNCTRTAIYSPANIPTSILSAVFTDLHSVANVPFIRIVPLITVCLKDAQVPFYFPLTKTFLLFDGEDNLCLWFIWDYSVVPFRLPMLFFFYSTKAALMCVTFNFT